MNNTHCNHKVGRVIALCGAIEKCPILLAQYRKNISIYLHTTGKADCYM